MLTSLAARIGSRPRRWLAFTLAFVVVAGIVGGPLAGSLKSSGGFAPPDSDSQVAQRKLQDATGREGSPGIVLLVATPRGPGADAARIAAVGRKLSRIPGIAATTAPDGVARDGRHVLVSGTIRTSADDSTVAKAAESAFTGDGAWSSGLGLSVDYTLFLLTRYREELARGVSPSEALGVTMRSAGRTVLFSAVTVACALATLTVFPQGFLKSMGIAGATVAIVAAPVAVTVSPALRRALAAASRRHRGPDPDVGAV